MDLKFRKRGRDLENINTRVTPAPSILFLSLLCFPHLHHASPARPWASALTSAAFAPRPPSPALPHRTPAPIPTPAPAPAPAPALAPAPARTSASATGPTSCPTSCPTSASSLAPPSPAAPAPRPAQAPITPSFALPFRRVSSSRGHVVITAPARTGTANASARERIGDVIAIWISSATAPHVTCPSIFLSAYSLAYRPARLPLPPTRAAAAMTMTVTCFSFWYWRATSTASWARDPCGHQAACCAWQHGQGKWSGGAW
ncbi:hypothetical protein BC937DRAFT_92956 [Endogone sp. FLAS-F59071]|nr:hypothetical protein BC937DRAFT_92956 [Endogone sp. FLAS-F59071]|eukprot:RUS21345.1 hypothetical protein BC937DRAFT_92956 [Endogone sp. FLAS-F59071]